ncbi:hypothetical protein RFI_21257 [Reticulomyxa filosa]|uniref:Uncharacterized protein n=1 Tax=Reticulomyxa filosa TaxID=46433 RepID=X6MSL3_RETFI|nr:hypothetical protein RFI_21257 [Reticulomyxa filosa]|eukprot:ETO16100.1 hypothetical protein RFI_21257 [Reticulomyxa filosa]
MASPDNTIHVRNLVHREQWQVLQGHSAKPNDVHFSSDGNMVVSCSDFIVRLWNVRSGVIVRMFQGHYFNILGCQISQDGNTIVSASYDGIRLWDTTSGEETNRLTYSGITRFVQFSPNGQLFVAFSKQRVQIWDTHSYKIVHQFPEYAENIEGRFSPDCCNIAFSSKNNVIKIYNLKSRNDVIVLQGHSGYITDLKFSSDSRTIVSCSKDKTVRLWDAELGVEIQRLEGHSSAVLSVHISQDGHNIVSLSDDGIIHLWESIAKSSKKLHR